MLYPNNHILLIILWKRPQLRTYLNRSIYLVKTLTLTNDAKVEPNKCISVVKGKLRLMLSNLGHFKLCAYSFFDILFPTVLVWAPTVLLLAVWSSFSGVLHCPCLCRWMFVFTHVPCFTSQGDMSPKILMECTGKPSPGKSSQAIKYRYTTYFCLSITILRKDIMESILLKSWIA